MLSSLKIGLKKPFWKNSHWALWLSTGLYCLLHVERLTYKSLDWPKFQWELFSLDNSRRNILFLQTDSQISEKQIAISSRGVVWKLLGKAKIFMTARWISIQRVLPQIVHFKTIETWPLHIFRWMVPRHLSYCLAWYRIRGTLDVLRSPWYNLDVCGLTNPMSAYLQKRQHSCAAILISVKLFLQVFLKPSQTKQTYKTISLSFSLGVRAWRDGVLSEQCQTNMTSMMSMRLQHRLVERIHSGQLGYLAEFWFGLESYKWAVSFRECCGGVSRCPRVELHHSPTAFFFLRRNQM